MACSTPAFPPSPTPGACSNSHLNAEFQTIARRDKKAFLSDQCKEIEENNRMGKTRDLFKKIRDTKGIFHAKMGSIKDRFRGKRGFLTFRRVCGLFFWKADSFPPPGTRGKPEESGERS